MLNRSRSIATIVALLMVSVAAPSAATFQSLQAQPEEVAAIDLATVPSPDTSNLDPAVQTTLLEARLLVSWQKTKIRALTRGMGATAQCLEDQIQDVGVSTALDTATGDALDQWGELVGEQRLGLDNHDYRAFIKARLLVNINDGTVDKLLELLEVAAAPVIRVFHASIFPACFTLVAERPTVFTDTQRRRVARLMFDASPGGRCMVLIETVPGAFGFDADPGAGGFDIGPFSRLIELP